MPPPPPQEDHMATGYVLVKASFTGLLGKEVLDFHEGEPVPADHPAVRRWPSAFIPVTSRFDDKSERIEQATAGPGEKRAR